MFVVYRKVWDACLVCMTLDYDPVDLLSNYVHGCPPVKLINVFFRLCLSSLNFHSLHNIMYITANSVLHMLAVTEICIL